MTVYLIHFERPIGDLDNPRGQAQHYIGCTDDLDSRLADHKAGRGAKIMAEVERQGIGWQVVRTWDGGFKKERALKARKKSWVFCPICGKEHERGKHG